jgi:molybdenum cofactor synthesis domain-containing protein
MKAVSVLESEGMVLCHDITEIIPGNFKGRAFKKGHIIGKEDIPKLLKIGKEHIYVWDMLDGSLHEDDAALRIAAAIKGNGVIMNEPSEGRVNLIADIPGLLKINTTLLEAINDIDQVVVSTLHSNQIVPAGKILAGCRVVPIVIKNHKIEKVENLCGVGAPVVEIKPLRYHKVGVVTTGSEVYHGRIKDQFGPVLKKKFEQLGSEVVKQIYVADDLDMITAAIKVLIEDGVDLITATGGMSVDPDDLTPAGIRAAGGNVVIYGAPVLPGSMFMLAYLGDVPVLGLPGCVMYNKNTIFDLIVPRILAGEIIQRKDIVRLGHGGLCSGCSECHFPNCSFGKSIIN